VCYESGFPRVTSKTAAAPGCHYRDSEVHSVLASNGYLSKSNGVSVVVVCGKVSLEKQSGKGRRQDLPSSCILHSMQGGCCRS
jgi:hypothetical protein